MSHKHQLRTDRATKSPIINATSRGQESEVIQALRLVVDHLENKFDQKISLVHERQWNLRTIVAELKHSFPEVEFHYHFESSSIRPDGGILYIQGKPGDRLSYPILISEVKNQGTNDLRTAEGLAKQAKGNAIERLGKNLIGLRTALLRESIFPFICFVYGCDFEADSSILDRVTTMAMFGQLNKTYLHNEEPGKFNRGSFYFRPRKWTVPEMLDVMNDITERSVLYYFSKYRENHFKKSEY
jgi:type II restriction enzyme